MGTETQEMVEEEVVQFVRADQVLCLLLDVAVLVCRDQFVGGGMLLHFLGKGIQ